LEEERIKKEQEEAAKAEKAQGKKAKEAAKNAMKKNKRILKGSVKDVNYFVGSGNASVAQVDGVLSDVELIMSKIGSEELASFAAKLAAAGKDASRVKAAYDAEVARLVGTGVIKEGEIKVFTA
jgi:DnaJ family protein C protein 2